MDRGRSEVKNSSTLDARVKATDSQTSLRRISGSGDDPPGMDESAKGYVRRGQSLAVRDDQKVMDAPGTNAAGAEKAEHLTV